MVELRFIAEKQSGQAITGSLTANNFGEAKKKIQKLAEKNKLRILKIEKKSTFLFKAQRGNDKPILGEQKAFNRQEVIDALIKLGYNVKSVNKKWFDLPAKPSHADIVMFVKVSAELLEQKLPYGEIISLLINDTQNKTLKETLKEINNDLKKGIDSEQTFMKYQAVFGRFTAFMLGLAAKSGNMAEIYRATAKFLERRQEFRKNLKSALITPFVTLIVLAVAVFFYVAYIFPETAKLFKKFDIELPPMTAFTLDMSDFLLANIGWILLSIAIPVIIFLRWATTKKGRLWVGKWMMKIPTIGSLIHKTYIEVFCRVFYTLYSGSAESITPIRISAEATDNKYFEDRIVNKSIPLMTKQGIGITDALTAAGVFTETALARIHSGEETGNIKNSMLQLANYYESDTVYRLKNIIELVQVVIAMIILIVMTLLTLVSAETATISPKRPGVSMIVEQPRQDIV